GEASAKPNPIRIVSITDGTSNTFGIIEAGTPVAWTKPADFDLVLDSTKWVYRQQPWLFSEGFHVAMVDGSVRRFGFKLPPKMFIEFATARGGEVIGDFSGFGASIYTDPLEAKAAREKLFAKATQQLQLLQEYIKNTTEVDELERLQSLVEELERIITPPKLPSAEPKK
ncbi:MAG: hypothetical protein ACRCZF_01355, partial [Gemmataceae bacterium]